MTSTEEFLNYLTVEQRKSSHTVEAYGRDLRQFAEWCGTAHEELFDAASVTANDIRAWIGHLSDNGLTPTSLRRKLQSLRAFYRWGRIREKFPKNPAADVVLTKKSKKLPEFINPDEVELLLDDQSEEFRALRQRTILEILYGLGLRQAELLAITDNDINFKGGEIRVTGKRNKQRVLPLPQQLADTIRDWQKARDARYSNLPAPRPLIAGPHGALSKNQLYRLVRSSLQGARSAKKSPHMLRHSFATAMVNNGADLDAVREMLGHTSLATTQIYTHLNIKELLNNYHSGHPRAKEHSKKIDK